MKIPQRSSRRGVAGLLIAALIFAMVFTAGMGYLIFQSQADNSLYSANIQAQRNRQLAAQEQITLCARPASSTSCTHTQPGTSLTLVVNDTGGFPVSVLSWFVRNTTSTGKILAPDVVQLTNPINLDVGNSTTTPLTGFKYMPGTVIFVSAITSRGNVFTVQYPLNATVSAITSSITTVTSTGVGAGGGNSLVVMMSASPLQAFTGDTITDNVTLFNFSNAPMTNPSIIPNPPSSVTTGTAGLTPLKCTGPSSGTIPAYTGGTVPHVYFLCTYRAVSGQVGGLASFSGSANVTQAGHPLYSAGTTSNLIQIGGLTNPLAQGAFTSNFFFFRYSSCNPTPSPCSPDFKSPANVSNFQQANLISAGNNYYVAFYLNITNNFNHPLPILGYTFVQLESSAGNESDWWIVGTNTSMVGGTYYPSYSGTPTLTSYPADCGNVGADFKPMDHNCLYVDPGKTVTITLAACGPSASKWDWGGSKYGVHFDGGVAGCTSSTPYLNNGGTSSGSATAAIIVISFEYGGATYTQDIAFHGITFTS